MTPLEKLALKESERGRLVVIEGGKLWSFTVGRDLPAKQSSPKATGG